MHQAGAGVPDRKLQHACRVVKPGRLLIRHLYELQSKTRKPHHHIPLRKSAWSDMGHIPRIVEQDGYHPKRISTSRDSSHPHQCGRQLWLWCIMGQPLVLGFQYQWPPAFRDKVIATKELLPIVMACMLWGLHWRDSSVIAHCDNMSVW